MTTVVHVGKFYPPVAGGMERVLESLCRAAPADIESRVLAFNTTRETIRETVDGIPVTRVGTIGAAGSVPIAPAFGRELRRTHGDVLVLHEPNPWALLSLAIVRPAIPLAIWFHSEVVRPQLQYRLFYHPMVRAVFGKARRIVVSSPLLAEHAAALAPYRDRITVIPFGIEASRWDQTPAIAARAAAIRNQTPRPIVLFAGRMVAYKGVDARCRRSPAGRARFSSATARCARPGQLARSCGSPSRGVHRSVSHEELPRALPRVRRVPAAVGVAREASATQLEAIRASPSCEHEGCLGRRLRNRHEETGLTVPPSMPTRSDWRCRRSSRIPAPGGAWRARARVVREFSLAQMAREPRSFTEIAAGRGSKGTDRGSRFADRSAGEAGDGQWRPRSAIRDHDRNPWRNAFSRAALRPL